MKQLLLFTMLVGILALLTTLPVQAGDFTATLTQFSDTLPGPSVEIDFSKGDWWVGLLFYLIMSWMQQRKNGARR